VITANSQLRLSTDPGISLHDITPLVRLSVQASGIKEGFVVVASRHTTTAVIINENEPRLLEDVRAFLEGLIPRDGRYLHNDIHLRDCPPDEPENAHAHIAAMLLGSSEVIPVSAGVPALGTWQSVMLVELDGPRERTVNLQVVGG
jgi:secondary thiamine-phosphate synthase enzyme